MKRVAIQGISGSFHHMAAMGYFGDEVFKTIECTSFNSLFDKLKYGEADFAIVAIENSVAGSIIPNYALIKNSGLKILGEVFLRIEQHLVGLHGQSIENINEVHSHPMAIEQCSTFLNPLRRKGVKIVVSEDTALSAKRIGNDSLKNTAAIASKTAAEIYGLQILSHSIENNKKNFTRFLIISNETNYNRHFNEQIVNKTSICFKLPHEQGSLSQALSVLAYYKMNLSKIQSLPIVGEEWHYLFYVDLVYSDYNRYRLALEAIKPLTDELQILGEYQRSVQPVKNITV